MSSSLLVGLTVQSIPWIRSKLIVHLTYVHLWVPILAILLVIKFYHGKKHLALLGMAGLLFGAAFFDYYWFTFCILLSIIGLFFLPSHRSNGSSSEAFSKRQILFLRAAGMVFLAATWLATRILLPVVNSTKSLSGSRQFEVASQEILSLFGGDIRDYLRPPSFHQIIPLKWDEANRGVPLLFAQDIPNYIGVSVLILFSLACFNIYRKKPIASDMRFLFGASFFLILLSLKPVWNTAILLEEIVASASFRVLGTLALLLLASSVVLVLSKVMHVVKQSKILQTSPHELSILVKMPRLASYQVVCITAFVLVVYVMLQTPSVSMPSLYVRWLFPGVRIFSRAGLIAEVLLVIVGLGITLDQCRRSRYRLLRIILPLAIVSMVALDLSPFSGRETTTSTFMMKEVNAVVTEPDAAVAFFLGDFPTSLIQGNLLNAETGYLDPILTNDLHNSHEFSTRLRKYQATHVIVPCAEDGRPYVTSLPTDLPRASPSRLYLAEPYFVTLYGGCLKATLYDNIHMYQILRLG